MSTMLEKLNQMKEEVEPKEIQVLNIEELQEIITNLNAEQTVLNNRLIKTLDLIEQEREIYKNKAEIEVKKNRELAEKTQEAFNLMKKKSEELKELHQVKLDQTLRESQEIQKTHMEMMRLLNDTIEQVKRIDKLTWKDRVKQYTIQSVITIGLMLMIFGVYTLINLLI